MIKVVSSFFYFFFSMDANNNQGHGAKKEYNFIIEGKKLPKKVTVQFKKNDKKEQVVIRIIKKK